MPWPLEICLNKTAAGFCAAAVNENLGSYRLATGAVREGRATDTGDPSSCMRRLISNLIITALSSPI